MKECCINMKSLENPQLTKENFNTPNFNLRLLVLIILVIFTILAGYLPYTFFKYLEYSRAIEEYQSVVKQTEVSFQIGISNKLESLHTVGTLMRSTCPSADTWPNCSINPELFDELSVHLKKMGGMQSLGTAPLISASRPQELLQFEHYASQVYLDAGISSFGLWSYPNSTVRGIVAVNGTGDIIHDTGGNPLSTNDYLAPLLHFTGTTTISASAGSVLFNLNHEPLRLDAIGDAVQCMEATVSSEDTNTCDRITDFVVPQHTGFEIAPAAMIIYPLAIEGELKLLVIATHYWGDVIEFSIPDYVHGLVIVLSTKVRTFTYLFNDGKVGTPVEGDTHDRDEDHRSKHSFVASVHGKDDVEYTVNLYASTAYYSSFEDNRAVYACAIGVSIAVITAVLFALYDYFLSRSAREHAVILATKRAFVRYISHEIRTPLNTVNIGLKVLMQELVGLPAFLAPPSPSSPQHTVSAPHLSLSHQFEEKQKELLDLVLEVEDSSDTAVGILNDLINYDKISMNNMLLELEVRSSPSCLLCSAVPCRALPRPALLSFTHPVCQLSSGTAVLYCVPVGLSVLPCLHRQCH